jgi:hypothetical protein
MFIKGSIFQQIFTLIFAITVQAATGHDHDWRPGSCERKTFENYQVLQAQVEDYETKMRLYKTFDQSKSLYWCFLLHGAKIDLKP